MHIALAGQSALFVAFVLAVFPALPVSVPLLFLFLLFPVLLLFLVLAGHDGLLGKTASLDNFANGATPWLELLLKQYGRNRPRGYPAFRVPSFLRGRDRQSRGKA